VLATLHEMNEDVKSSSPPEIGRTLHQSYPARASPGALPSRLSGSMVVTTPSYPLGDPATRPLPRLRIKAPIRET